MADTVIRDPSTKSGMGVTDGGRGRTITVTQSFSGAASRLGKLYSIGTGSITPTAGGARSVLWLRNDDNDNEYVVTDLIFGWNGGSTNFNRTIFGLIHYNTGVPLANKTLTDASVENITKASGSAAGTLDNFTGYVWDGVSTGMTSGSGGFAQVGNRIGQGNTSLNIDGEIVLGKGDSMEMRVTPEEDGLFNIAVVFAVVPIGGFEELF